MGGDAPRPGGMMAVERSRIDRLLAAWRLPQPQLRGDLGGINNRTLTVTSGSDTYLLRLYHTGQDLRDAEMEHRLLSRLAQTPLPFAVPAPLAARSGHTIVQFESEGTERYATLFPRIPGAHPYGAGPEQIAACGRALAHLDRALASIHSPEETGMMSPFMHLNELHPLVPDPTAAIASLPMPRDDRLRILEIFDSLTARFADLWRRLPRQLVHRDLDASNVLMAGERVTGLLDFEFAGHDLRIIDLARSLALFTAHPWSDPAQPFRLAAFARGYQSVIALDAAERAAIPDAMLLFRAISLIAREGRRLQGTAQPSDVLSRARELLRMDDWLRTSYAGFAAQAFPHTD